MSDTAILVTGAVALGVPCVAAWWARSAQRQQLAHDREMRDLDELRRVFDEAADHVVEAEIALTRWRSAMLDPPMLLVDQVLRRQAYAERDDLLQAANAAQLRVASSLGRLGMRLGRDAPVFRRYLTVTATLEEFAHAGAAESLAFDERVRAAATGKEPDTSEEEMTARRREWFEALDLFHTARVAFVDEAAGLIRTRLPSDNQRHA